MAKGLIVLPACAAMLLGACSQAGFGQQDQAPTVPPRAHIVGYDLRDDGRKTVLVEQPNGALQFCDLRGGGPAEPLSWECVDLPPLPATGVQSELRP